MKRLRNNFLLFYLSLISLSCSGPTIRQYSETGKDPDIYPDYREVTVPVNIAPLNFRLRNWEKQGMLFIEGNNKRLKLFSSNGRFTISPSAWKKLLKANAGGKIKLTVFIKDGTLWKRNHPFSIKIAADRIDPYLVYRLIEPGYELWEKMGIYQRDLENFEETAIFENKMTGYNCVNCHSFCMQNPGKMLFHMRGAYGGTILADGKNIEKLDTKTDSAISPFVYPAWHPSGKYIAFSVNDIAQAFYLNNKSRIEVFDSRSDVVVYDIQKHEVFSSPLLSSRDRMETFPGFSPDGENLYFCTAKSQPIPQKPDSVRYSLCSVSFDMNNRIFGETADTIYNARILEKSASFPRVSPDGNYLLFTVSGFGSFPIWHKDADLCLYDIRRGNYVDMGLINSEDTESYHSWASNSRWIVFSSRRDDGLYTRLYIAYIAPDDKPGKAFMLPQRNAGFYDNFMKSYNLPELVTGKTDIDSYLIARKAKSGNGKKVLFIN